MPLCRHCNEETADASGEGICSSCSALLDSGYKQESAATAVHSPRDADTTTIPAAEMPRQTPTVGPTLFDESQTAIPIQLSHTTTPTGF